MSRFILKKSGGGDVEDLEQEATRLENEATRLENEATQLEDDISVTDQQQKTDARTNATEARTKATEARTKATEAAQAASTTAAANPDEQIKKDISAYNTNRNETKLSKEAFEKYYNTADNTLKIKVNYNESAGIVTFEGIQSNDLNKYNMLKPRTPAVSGTAATVPTTIDFTNKDNLLRWLNNFPTTKPDNFTEPEYNTLNNLKIAIDNIPNPVTMVWGNISNKNQTNITNLNNWITNNVANINLNSTGVNNYDKNIIYEILDEKVGKKFGRGNKFNNNFPTGYELKTELNNTKGGKKIPKKGSRHNRNKTHKNRKQQRKSRKNMRYSSYLLNH